MRSLFNFLFLTYRTRFPWRLLYWIFVTPFLLGLLVASYGLLAIPFIVKDLRINLSDKTKQILLRKDEAFQEEEAEIPKTKDFALPPTDSIFSNYKATFATYVAGVSYRQKALRSIVRDIEEEQYLIKEEQYGGLSNKEIQELYFDGDVIYQYEPLDIPYVNLMKEPENNFNPNAIAVYAGVDPENLKHIGYIPDKHLEKVHEIIKNTYSIEACIKGGKFKMLVDDEIVTDRKDYYVDISMK